MNEWNDNSIVHCDNLLKGQYVHIFVEIILKKAKIINIMWINNIFVYLLCYRDIYWS